LKNNAGEPCTAKGFNSCYNALARARHNDLREGHEWVTKTTGQPDVITMTPPLAGDDAKAKTLQALMNSSVFTGVASSLKPKVPTGCSMSFYEETNSAKVAALPTSHAATDAWYHEGKPWYDAATGATKAGATAGQQELGYRYTRMLWKSTTKVAFGIKGKYVVAWYCSTVADEAAPKPADFKKNVGTSCLVFDAADQKKVYNECYNKRQRTLHNAKRILHEARDLDFNKEASIQIQILLNAMTRGDAVEMPASSARQTTFRTCGENIFTGSGAVNAFTTGAATDDWYAGVSDYDFKAHAAKSTAKRANSDQFT